MSRGGEVAAPGRLSVLLAGDVMTGRAIDQVLPQSVEPTLHEPAMRSALGYVRLAEEASGAIPRRVGDGYVWGDALEALSRARPDVRIVNLETAVTTSDDWWRGKRVHYRMHPENVGVLKAAEIDLCVLANNHVMDWGEAGLRETLRVLADARLAVVGAGLDAHSAARPAALDTPSGRLLVFAYASPTAGVPVDWAAGRARPGVNLLRDLTPTRAREVCEHVAAHRRPGDRVVISLHWGGNWGFGVPATQRDFAHRLVDAGAADVIYGHSSHHPKGLEVYRDRLILYGCGDFVNDYEGIMGEEAFGSELALTYVVTLEPSGRLQSLEMTPLRIRRFRLQRAADDEAVFLRETMQRESRPQGVRVESAQGGTLTLRWPARAA